MELGQAGADREAVFLDAAVCRKLCAAVRIDPAGETIHEVAAKLGVTVGCLLAARIKGVFRTRHKAGLGGHRGHPVPLLYSDEWLDPSSPMFALPHAAWGWTWQSRLDRIPAELGQTLVRERHYVSQVARMRYRDRHPEIDGVGQGKWRLRRLPRAGADESAWYKWKGDQYIGYDWRAAELNPSIARDYELLERKRERDRLRKRAAYWARPRVSRAAGSVHFDGWRWICPVCGRACRTICYPLARVNVLEEDESEAAGFFATEMKRLIEPLAEGFACTKCHGVTNANMTNARDAWNYFIRYLTGGLLYGHEVARPAEFAGARKRAYRPRMEWDAEDLEDGEECASVVRRREKYASRRVADFS